MLRKLALRMLDDEIAIPGIFNDASIDDVTFDTSEFTFARSPVDEEGMAEDLQADITGYTGRHVDKEENEARASDEEVTDGDESDEDEDSESEDSEDEDKDDL